MVKCAPLFSTVDLHTHTWKNVASPCTAEHCSCETVMGDSAMCLYGPNFDFSLPSLCLQLTPPVIDKKLGNDSSIQEIE